MGLQQNYMGQPSGFGYGDVSNILGQMDKSGLLQGADLSKFFGHGDKSLL